MTCGPRFYPGLGPPGEAVPNVTVAGFANLPTTRPDGYLVAVTGETGLTDVIVRWDAGGGAWAFEVVIVTGANVAAVNTGLAGIRTVSGVTPATSALATIGADTWLLTYDAIDARWYGVVEDGSELAPYTTASTGQTGISALPTSPDASYGIMGRGTGTPIATRLRIVTLTDSGQRAPTWMTPTVYAYGAPTQARGIVRMAAHSAATNRIPHANFTTSSITTNGQWNTSTGRCECPKLTLAAGTRAAYSKLAIIASDLSLIGLSGLSNDNFRFIGVRSSSDSGQIIGLAAGYTSGIPSNTHWCTYNGAGALVSTGVAFASETYWQQSLDLATDTMTVWTGGAADAYSGASVVVSATTDFLQIGHVSTGANTNTASFSVMIFLGWT